MLESLYSNVIKFFKQAIMHTIGWRGAPCTTIRTERGTAAEELTKISPLALPSSIFISSLSFTCSLYYPSCILFVTPIFCHWSLRISYSRGSKHSRREDILETIVAGKMNDDDKSKCRATDVDDEDSGEYEQSTFDKIISTLLCR